MKPGEPITRAEVEQEIYQDRIRLILKERLEAPIETSRINEALCRPIGDVERQAKWVTMKKRTAATARRRREEVTQTMQMLRDLRGLDPDGADLDEIIALSAFGRSLKVEYDRNVIPTPDWLDDRLDNLERAARLLRQDALEKKLKELQSRKEALKTAEQKRQDVDAELEKVRAALGKTTD